MCSCWKKALVSSIFHMDHSSAQKNPPEVISMPEKKEFEIRVVIWSVHDIPRLKGMESADLKVQITYDPMGWLSDETIKETDVHHNSDGWGEFNWRQAPTS
jgi:hypothetical protein